MSGIATPPSPNADIAAGSSAPVGRRALLIGINDYRSPAIPRLRGCANDVMAMRNLLLEKYGFREQDICTLVDHDATYDAIVGEFKTCLIQRAEPRDIVVIQFSGHGSRVEIGSDPSGFEEAIVPYDSRDPANLDITGAAFSALLRELARKTKNITVVFDCCHSGRMVNRSDRELVEVRGIPASHDAAPATPFSAEAVRTFSWDTSQFSPLDDSYVLVAAALARQTAKEYAAGLERYGALTYFLVQELHAADLAATYRGVLEKVELKVADNVADQTPQLVGPNSDKYIFGNEHKIGRPGVVVMSSGLTTGKVRLPFTGEIHGVTVGSQYDVYAPDSEPGAGPLAKIEISSVTPFASEARIVEGGRIPDYAHAILREQRLAGKKLRIWVQDLPPSAPMEAIRKRLQSSPDLELIADRDACHVQVIQENGNILLYSPDGTRLSEPAFAGQADVDQDILEQVLKWARWFYMLGLENPSSGLKVSLSIRPAGGSGEAQRGTSLPQLPKAKMVFHPGDLIDVEMHNDSDRTLFVSLLVLSTDRSISVLYPSRGLSGAAIEVKPKASQPLGFSPRATLPAGFDMTRDNFLLIATVRPIELFSYEQTGFVKERSRGASDLRGLLEQGSVAMRGWTNDPGEWTTCRMAVEVHKL